MQIGKHLSQNDIVSIVLIDVMEYENKYDWCSLQFLQNRAQFGMGDRLTLDIRCKQSTMLCVRSLLQKREVGFGEKDIYERRQLYSNIVQCCTFGTLTLKATFSEVSAVLSDIVHHAAVKQLSGNLGS